MTFYPDNTLAHYKVQLPRPISLEGEWEVGMSEIQYPHTWYNVTRAWFVVGDDQSQAICTIELSDGYYSSPTKLVNEMNRMAEEQMCHKEIKFVYESITQKVWIKLDRSYSVTLSPKLQHLLGFDKSDITETEQAPQVVDMAQGFHNLYVYTNIVEPRVVGDSLVPLLRIVPVQGTNGKMVATTYENVQYAPVQVKQFQTIDVYIRDDTGQPVSFERGKVVVTLHLRRRQLLP